MPARARTSPIGIVTGPIERVAWCAIVPSTPKGRPRQQRDQGRPGFNKCQA